MSVSENLDSKSTQNLDEDRIETIVMHLKLKFPVCIAQVNSLFERSPSPALAVRAHAGRRFVPIPPPSPSPSLLGW